MKRRRIDALTQNGIFVAKTPRNRLINAELAV